MDEVGIPLIEIAIAWVINHPAVTSAIIGPRTLEHLESQLPAASRTLDAELLDRIDEIVPPASGLHGITPIPWRRQVGRTSASMPRTRML